MKVYKVLPTAKLGGAHVAVTTLLLTLDFFFIYFVYCSHARRMCALMWQA